MVEPLEVERYLPEADGALTSGALGEHEVLALVAQGRSNQEISQRLMVTESTVRWHVHNVLQKLNAKNRTDAVRIGQERRLIAEVGPGR